MIAQIATGITAEYTGSALASILTGGLWREKAKQDVTFPYSVFHIIDDLQYETFSEEMEYSRIQFDLWSKYSGTETEAIATLDALESALRTLYDYATLTISGWSTTEMRFLGSRPAFSEDDKIEGVIIEYEIYIFKSK